MCLRFIDPHIGERKKVLGLWVILCQAFYPVLFLKVIAPYIAKIEVLVLSFPNLSRSSFEFTSARNSTCSVNISACADHIIFTAIERRLQNGQRFVKIYCGFFDESQCIARLVGNVDID